MDYTPLMAYIEKILGFLSHAYDPASVALDSSRGYEEGHHRAFMRFTVLVIDALVGVSAFVALAFKLEATTKRRALLIALCVLAPAPILVDHGARAASETRHRREGPSTRAARGDGVMVGPTLPPRHRRAASSSMAPSY